jgi:hypothetical protein
MAWSRDARPVRCSPQASHAFSLVDELSVPPTAPQKISPYHQVTIPKQSTHDKAPQHAPLSCVHAHPLQNHPPTAVANSPLRVSRRVDGSWPPHTTASTGPLLKSPLGPGPGPSPAPELLSLAPRSGPAGWVRFIEFFTADGPGPARYQPLV